MTLEEYVEEKFEWPTGTIILDNRSDAFYVFFLCEDIACGTDVFVSMVVPR